MTNVDQRTINNLSLCSGGGGLDLGLELALGTTRTVCWVEWEAFAAEFLASRMEAGCLAQAPVWTDLRTFNGKPWRGVVDCITAGYPCQPFSLAGDRGGSDDPRHLWPHVHRVIEEVRPGIVFAENVPGHLTLGADQVIADLQAMGYDVAANVFSACEVGATHIRERLFILALDLDDTECAERRPRATEGHPAAGLDLLQRRSQGATHVASTGIALGIFPPAPNDIKGWRQTLANDPTVAPVESEVCELVDGLAVDRTQWLRLFGNGVVPLQAAYAFLSLWSCLRTRVGRIAAA